MADLFTLYELASYLQQDLDTATATRVRVKATNYLRGELGVEFEVAARAHTERVPATEAYARLLGPLVSVESVEVDGVALVEDVDWARTKRGVTCPAGFGARVGTAWVDIEISYTAGFDTIPGDLADAGMQLAGIAYMRGPIPGVKAATLTVEGVTQSETYTADESGARDLMALDEITLRELRHRYGTSRPRTGSVRIR